MIHKRMLSGIIHLLFFVIFTSALLTGCGDDNSGSSMPFIPFPHNGNTEEPVNNGNTEPNTVIVPNIIGMLQSQAESTITAANLIVGAVTEEKSVSVPAGYIINQNPAPGVPATQGTPVDMVSSLGFPLPPDPSDTAPPIERNVASNIATNTEFLYTGDNPIQTGVESGAIDEKRVGVTRGRTLKKDGSPLSGVSITILKHPEFGQTLSREDGMFDMAANGGGLLIFNYEKAGYIPAQRQINLPWQEYSKLPDVVLIPYDTNAKYINFEDDVQTARSGITSDKRGDRRVTLIFSGSASASMTLPDRSKSSLESINVRATEYTVGVNGPESMPAVLPPTSGYTYCVELSADEAVTNKAVNVQFDEPVYSYVEDTIGFPVGSAVPAGYYDREEGRWVASENGRVIEILSINFDGLAEIDIDGDSLPDNEIALDSLGFTDAEREELAILYPDPPQVLWRVPITHFTPWDYNWPYGPPEGAEPPNQPDPETSDPECDPCEGAGSILEYQNQALGERIPIVGTPFSLNYRSSRVKGNKASFNLNVTLSEGTSRSVQPESVFLDINIGGQHQHEEITYDTILANIEEYAGRKYPWDGNDAYGRKMQGAQPVSVNIGYVYEAQYYAVQSDYEQSFASARGGVERIDSDTNPMIALTQNWKGIIGAWDMQAQKIGGWSLDIHHSYSPTAKVLYLGDGRRRTNARIPAIIKTIAGNGSSLGDGGPAIDAELESPFDIAIAPDGSYYIADQGDHRIRRVSADGIITTVAGNGAEGFSGDGGPATEAQLNGPMGVSIAPDGNLYIADSFNNRIRCIGTDGIITTIAGDGNIGSSGDGGPATEAQLYLPYDVSAAPDGSVYIVDSINCRIRRVGANGIISTVAGGGESIPGDGEPATDALLALPWGVTAAPDGSLYIAEYGGGRIRRVSVDGIITTVAGGGSDDPGDGGLATDALLTAPTDVVTAPNGGIYIAHLLSSGGYGSIRHVGTDGIITTIAGGVTYDDVMAGKASVDDFIPATQALIMPTSIVVIPDGTLYITSGNIIHITQPLSGYSAEDILIPSEDGSELYHFNPNGRHLRTLNTMTGSTIYEFTYNEEGLLISVEDMNGNVTTIERDDSGNATAIIGPNGQSTTLSYDSNDYLAGITNPAAESHSFEYTDDGLLIKLTDPRTNEFKYEYDDMGRLTNIKQPNSTDDYKTLVRDKFDDGYQVNLTTAEGRTSSYLVEELSSGEKRLLNSSGCCGNEVIMSSDGAQTITYADGTVITQQDGPDPRWGIQAPVTKNFSIELPSALLYKASISHEVDLENPLDLFSINSMTTIMRINYDQLNPTGSHEEYTSFYNALNRTLTSTTREGCETEIVFDENGRITQAHYGDIYPFNFSYDSNGRVETITQGSGGDARVISITHNSEGYQDSITNAADQTTGLSYDWAGRVASASLPGGRTLGISYDANGSPTSITPPGRPSHNFAYNEVNLISEYDPPFAYSGEDRTSYDYNLDRQVITITRPDGKSLDVAYDSYTGRIEELTVSRGIVDYIYNESTGQISSITSPDGVTNTFAYDGFLLTDEAWSGEFSGSVSSTYNKGLRVDSTAVIPAVGDPSSIIFGEDNDGRVTSAGNMSISREASAGFVSGTVLGLVITAYTYNGFGEIESYTVNDGASDVFSQIFVRDKLGRVIGKTESIESIPTIYDYTYDNAGRLINVSINGGVSNFTYTYDDNGNRMSYDAPGAGNDVTCAGDDYDNQDRLLDYGNNQYTYTNNGDLSSKTVSLTDTTTYDYDVLGNLISVTLPDASQITYIIDGKNRRVGKKRNGTLEQVFLYKDNLIVAELDGSGNLVSRFVYASNPYSPDYMIRGGVTYRIISDLQGSPRLIVNTTGGTIAQRIDYDEFGNIISDTNSGFQPFGFAGGLYDVDTKLVRFGARDYDPETGRWTTKDPIRFMGGDTNLYGYVMNDPINFIDPSGLCSATITRLKGDVQVDPGAPCKGEGNMNDITGPIGKGFNLKEGDTVKTGPKSRVEIKLGDNAVIRLGSNSQVTISDSLCNGGKSRRMRTMGGQAWAIVQRLGDDSNFTIKTRTAVAGVRG